MVGNGEFNIVEVRDFTELSWKVAEFPQVPEIQLCNTWQLNSWRLHQERKSDVAGVNLGLTA
jgi:hypothetical protein